MSGPDSVADLALHHEVPGRVLAVYAHPDDAEVSAGGTLARWAAEGAEVRLLVCTRGDKGASDPAVDPEDLTRRRREETRRSSELLGFAGVDHLDHPDGELDNDLELRAELVEALRRHRPDTVVSPDPTAVFFGDRYYNHRDHRELGFATLDAVSPAAGNPHYFGDRLGGDLAVHAVAAVFLSGTLEPNCAVDISGTIEAKIDALFAHESQLGEAGEWFREFMRDRAEDAGRQAGVRYAEAFRRLSFVG